VGYSHLGTSEQLGIVSWRATTLWYSIASISTALVGLRSPDKSQTKFIIASACDHLQLPQRWTISESFSVARDSEDYRTIIEDPHWFARTVCNGARIVDLEEVTSWLTHEEYVVTLARSFASGNY
jgi:hypothetical protein